MTPLLRSGGSTIRSPLLNYVRLDWKYILWSDKIVHWILSTDENSSLNSSITFLSSFQSPLLSEGLKRQTGWGHVWNRFAGPLSCRGQPSQCALTPMLPPAWWEGLWQSPIPRDVQRMEAYGMKLSGFGTSDDSHLSSFCRSRTNSVVVTRLI